MKKRKNEYLSISDYGVIGNLHTIALVSSHGSIDYLPFHRIDSPTVFTSLLDKDKGGFFEIISLNTRVNYKQMYLPDTNVLLTRFLSEDGVAELTDFMPIRSDEERCVIIRSLKIIRGNMRFCIKCYPVFNYARHAPEVEITKEGIVFRDTSGLQGDLILISDPPLEIIDHGAHCELDLEERDTISFVLKDPTEEKPIDPEEQLDKTLTYWKTWASKSNYQGRWGHHVTRSALILKLLCSEKYGSVVAAGTFGLPEQIGGARNWDYRYLWMRDAAFTMYVFLQMGYRNEARNFMDWVKDRGLQDGTHLIYRVDGSRDLEEIILDHLEGYKKSIPVRIGNAASEQLQIDIYGELIDTIYLYVKHEGSITYNFWKQVRQQIEYVCKNWQRPDNSLWEVRTQRKEFLHTRLLCWVALDRGIKIAEITSFPADIVRWREIRNNIYNDIFDNFYNEEVQAFVQYNGADHVDASALLMPLLRFCSTREPKWISTFEKIKRDLVTEPLVYRYRDPESLDGLAGTEATISICSFWYIECLARMGRLKEAILNFEKMIGYANNLGLYSEEIGLNGDQLGNYPQAYTHLSLISAAIRISKESEVNQDQYEESGIAR